MPFDPWSGLNAGTQGLRQLVETQQQDRMYNAKMDAVQRQQKVQQGLKDLHDQLTQAGVPERDKYKKMAEYAAANGDMKTATELESYGSKDLRTALGASQNNPALQRALTKQLTGIDVPEGKSRVVQEGGFYFNEDPSGRRTPLQDPNKFAEEQALRHKYTMEEQADYAERQRQLAVLRGENRTGRVSHIGYDAEGNAVMLSSTDENGPYTIKNGVRKYDPIIAGTTRDAGKFTTDEMVAAARQRVAELDAAKKAYTAGVGKEAGLTVAANTVNQHMEAAKQKAAELGLNDTRLLNKSFGFLRKEFAGTGKQEAFETYMTSLAVEIAKLAEGTVGGNSAPSVSSQKEWREKLDKAIGFQGLKEVFDTAKELGGARVNSQREENQRLLKKLGVDTGAPEPTVDTTSTKNEPKRLSTYSPVFQKAIKSKPAWINAKVGEQVPFTNKGETIYFIKE